MGEENECSHVCFADESYYLSSRFRSVAVLSMAATKRDHLESRLRALLPQGNGREFKWEKLRTGDYRNMALALIDFTIEQACSGGLRLDVLAWDTADRRHNVERRDDLANLGRMYYHLLRDVLVKRWPDDAVWRVHPDQNSAIQWDDLQWYLDGASVSGQIQLPKPGETRYRMSFRTLFELAELAERISDCAPFIQLADLFAGLSVFSRASFDRYTAWQVSQSVQTRLPFGNEPNAKLTNSEKYRCDVLGYFNKACKDKKLGVSLQKNQYLVTFNPENPLNFWWYEPKHTDDKAPIKSN
jgi:hypothetical protein